MDSRASQLKQENLVPVDEIEKRCMGQIRKMTLGGGETTPHLPLRCGGNEAVQARPAGCTKSVKTVNRHYGPSESYGLFLVACVGVGPLVPIQNVTAGVETYHNTLRTLLKGER